MSMPHTGLWSFEQQGFLGFALIILVILAGLIVLLAAVHRTREIIHHLPHERRWRTLYTLMRLSCVGYVLFAVVILTPYHLLHGWVTAVVFLGGAVFASMVVRSTLLSIQNLLRLREMDLRLHRARSLEELQQELVATGMALVGADGGLLEWQGHVFQSGEKALHELTIPLESEGQGFGTLTVCRQSDAFGSDEELLLKTLLHHAVVAMERLAAMQANQLRLERLLVDQMSDGVFMADPQGAITLINPAARRMLAPTPVHHVSDLLPWRIDLQAVQTAMTEAGERIHTQEMRLDHGPAQVVIAKSVLLTDIRGKPLGTVTTLMDVTKERELQQLKEEFLASVSHELRTPVTMIAGYSELLQEDGTDETQRHEFVAILSQSARRLLTLINDLLDLTKLEAGMMTMHFQATALVPMVGSVMADLRPLAAHKQQTLEWNLPPDLPPVEADPDRIGQVLTNLVANAIKFTPEGGCVTVRVALVGDDPAQGNTTGPDLRVSVADTGPGIAPQDRERIFQKYQQVENKWTYGIKGTGLGLPIAKQIVEAHGGRIWVDSQDPQGSVFQFTLPCARGVASSFQPESVPTQQNRSGML